MTIDDLELSRQHARLKLVDGTLEVEDLGSLNGTWVNGARIPAPTRLNPGDVVKVGVTVIEVLEDPQVQMQAEETMEALEESRAQAPGEEAIEWLDEPQAPKPGDEATVQRPAMRPQGAAEQTPEPAAPAAPAPAPPDRARPDDRTFVPESFRPPEPVPPAEPLRPAEPAPPLPTERISPAEGVPPAESLPPAAAPPAAAPPAAPPVAAPPVAPPAAAPARVRRLGVLNLDWLAGASVIPFALLTLAAVGLPASAIPGRGSEAPKFQEFFIENDTKILVAFGLMTVAVFFFFPYLGLLWRTFRQVEGEPAWLSAVVFGSGLSIAAISVAGNAFWGAAAHRADEGLSPEVARVLFDLGSIFYMPWLPISVFLAVSALLILHTNVFPRWLGLGSAIATPLVLLSGIPADPLIFQILAYLGLTFWVVFTVVTGLTLMRRSGGSTAPA